MAVQILDMDQRTGDNGIFYIVTVGQMKRGKSTLYYETASDIWAENMADHWSIGDTMEGWTIEKVEVEPYEYNGETYTTKRMLVEA